MAKGKGAGQDSPRLEDKGKGKEVKPLPEAKGTEVALKTMLLLRPRMLIPNPRKLIPKMPLLEPRHSFRTFFFYFSLLFCTFSFVMAVCHYL